MQKIYYYILSIILLLFYSSCSENTEDYPGNNRKSVSIKLIQYAGFSTKVIDGDNLQSEQTVKNISVFFTEPSSNVITNKYVYSGFSSVDDYKLITLPLDPATVLRKDIYIVANYDNTATLNSVSTVDALKALTTPAVDKRNNLAPANGFCMYGSTLNFNFNDAAHSPAVVDLVRSCAKIRINVTFPENPTLSTNNSFLIQNAAKYTYVIGRTKNNLPTTDYFTYAAPIALVDNGAHVYTQTTYVYEADNAPVLYIYTYMGGGSTMQEFSVTLPKPIRNQLFDISIEIYSGNSPTGTKSINENNTDKPAYKYKSMVNIYDEKGRKVTYCIMN
ncbi:hypothetical protein [Dysgonomonas termitidis]|uniref:Major fimbrial subunit protein N-terminal domain-containing protein n=1 Tax=Dysgonomonas termitidis TaxID=1516126 RepID=A0ABV9KZZ1_9BACT